MRKPPPAAHRLKWMRALLLALPLLSLPLLYAALGAPRSSPPAAPPRRHARGRPPPRLAYLISGAGPGDGPRIRRLLRALYHPWNCYLVGVAGEEDRADLEAFVRGQEAPRRYGNVRVAAAGEWAAVTRRGPTELAATLHAAALLLREFDGWSWFINLSASDYPLMPQDGKIQLPHSYELPLSPKHSHSAYFFCDYTSAVMLNLPIHLLLMAIEYRFFVRVTYYYN
jgi:beta-glucuronosyltransferase